MSDTLKLGIILLAGGQGKRFQESIQREESKLLSALTLDNTPSVIEQAFSRVTDYLNYEEIIIVSHPDWQTTYQNLLMKHPNYSIEKTRWVTGGELRKDSVEAGLNAFSSHINLVMIHDGARPIVLKNDIQKLYQAVIEQKGGGAALAHPLTNTIKTMSGGTENLKTIDRNTLWEVYTPQLFYKSDLEKAYAYCNQIKNQEFTDDLQLLEVAGITPTTLVKSSKYNLKINDANDVDLLQFLIKKVFNHSLVK